MILREIPEAVDTAFRQMCAENDWSPAEVLTMIMKRAVKEDIGNALAIATQRDQIGKKGLKRWLQEFCRSLS